MDHVKNVAECLISRKMKFFKKGTVLILICFQINTKAEPIGDNTCKYTDLETTKINTTYLQSAQVKTYKFCLTQITLRCAEYKTVLETKWKEENITRAVVKTKCCTGYKEANGLCVPHCSRPCINGICDKPESCLCNSGFSGESCQVSGCPDGRWGPDCSKDCTCENGGHCNPVHGACACTPGYHGLRCQTTCPEGYYGAACEQECSCSAGFRCNHVTGDCVPCDPGYYGSKCRDECKCDQVGTELCSNTDGRCFCRDNWFGPGCEFNCPFGFLNSTCYTQPINNKTCSCSNYLHICHLDLGCVCPQGLDCGVQTLREVLEVSPLSDQGQEGLHGSSTATIVVVLIISLAALILIVVYYRRRMKVLKTDLDNRSVRYTQNSYHTGAADIVIHDNHPLDSEYLRPPREEAGHAAHPSQEAHHTRLLQAGTELLNNQITLSSQGLLRSNNLREERKEKNTNIDNFKLGYAHSDNSDENCHMDKNSCKGLTVALDPDSCGSFTYGAKSCGPGSSACGLGEEASSCGGAAACGATDDVDDDGGEVGNGSGVLHSDVNLLQHEIQKEKAIKAKISLSFKNNISRSQVGAKREEKEDKTPSFQKNNN